MVFKAKQAISDVSKLKSELAALRLVQHRHSPDGLRALTNYIAAEQTKNRLEKEKVIAKNDLDNYAQAILATHEKRINELLQEGVPLEEALIRAAETQMRPILMATLGAAIGLFPAAVATGIGSQAQQPLARVVVGGMITAAVLILVVLPVLYYLFNRGHAPGGVQASPPAAGPVAAPVKT